MHVFDRAFALAPILLLASWTATTPASADALEAPRRFVIEIRDREVQRESGVVRVTQGDRVELTWITDEPVALHLHGYDVELAVRPGEPANMTFTAHATGRFPVTSHGFEGEIHGHLVLLYLEVHPD